MRTSIAIALLLATPAAAAEPVLTDVTLSAGGVAQLTYRAQVTASAEPLTLDVPLDQVDDLLKSLSFDDAAGPPSIRLPGRQPLDDAFRTLPFKQDALESRPALLATLVGEPVRLPAQGVAGMILAVTPFQAALPHDGGTTTHHRLTIATQAGLETAVLEDTAAIELTSEALRRQLATALAAIARQRAQDRRTLTITPAPGPARGIGFSYVVPTPVWKTSYRLTADPDGTTARLQAYAVVENLTGREWDGVDLTLTSGQPVLYHQPLYDPVFTTRPEAPVEVANRLTPQRDEGAIPPPPPAPAAPRRASAALFDAARESEPAPGPAAVTQAATQVEFRLAGISATAGQSLALPILDRTIPAQRVALIQPATDTRHPLVALLLANDGPGALPPGLATLYERRAEAPRFVGDARLPAVQPGEQRLATFAADLAVRVQITRTVDTALVTASAAQGVLTLRRRERAATTYRIATPAGSGRTIMLEHPTRPGFTLVEPRRSETTPTAYRITRAIPAGATTDVEVVLERPVQEQVVLTDAALNGLRATAWQGPLPDAVRGAVERAAALRTALEQRRNQLAALRETRTGIVDDQERVRQNLAAVPVNSELHRRLLGHLQAQEDALAALATRTEQAERELVEAQRSLDAYLAALTF